jgi:hypothetical protein
LTIPVQSFLQGRPATGTVNSRTAVEQQFSDTSVVDAGRRDKRLIQLGSSINKDSSHLYVVGFVLTVQRHALQ